MASSVLLSRKTIITRGGAGQMMASQAAFFKNRGYDVKVCCAKFGRGASEAFAGIQSWSIPRPAYALLPVELRARIYESRVAKLRGRGVLIDHGESMVEADIAYVHNYLAPEFAQRLPGYVANERLPWRSPASGTVLVANSVMVCDALIETLDQPADRVVVIYPGYNDERFNPENRQRFRHATRQKLGIGSDEILVGLITSGHFHKRGLDRFIECFEMLSAKYPGLRGLVVGGKRAPAELASNTHYRSGRVVHKPVTDTPERYTAALDLVLYPARYEEFGIVVLEAMAMGIPIVTSSAVGAAELLGDTPVELVIDAARDSVDAFCKHAIEVLELDQPTKSNLSATLSDRARDFSQRRHNVRLAALIENIGN